MIVDIIPLDIGVVGLEQEDSETPSQSAIGLEFFKPGCVVGVALIIRDLIVLGGEPGCLQENSNNLRYIQAVRPRSQQPLLSRHCRGKY